VGLKLLAVYGSGGQTFIDHGETPEAIIKALREALVS